MSKKWRYCWRRKNLAEAWRLYKKLAAIPQSRIFNPVKKLQGSIFAKTVNGFSLQKNKVVH